MLYTYSPAYYSSFQDTITSLCKAILPSSLRKKRLTAVAAAEQTLAKQQSDNLKWQQESFRQMVNLMGLRDEGILQDAEVSEFRVHLLETLVASPVDHEPEVIIRDKLQFLQELYYAKCISDDEYHSSKRPLLQRLAIQGAEINCRDVIAAGPTTKNDEEEWSVIDIKDEHCLVSKDSVLSRNKPKHRTPFKQLRGAVSVISTASAKSKEAKKGAESATAKESLNCDPNQTFDYSTNTFRQNSVRQNQLPILMAESPPLNPNNSSKENVADKGKNKVFRSLFGGDTTPDLEEKVEKSGRTQWSFKKWKKSTLEDESTVPYLPPGERSDYMSSTPCVLVASPIGEGPNTKQIKRKIHSDGSSSDFFIDKVLGENIKRELSRIQEELSTGNPTLNFSNEQIDAISTRLPVDKADLKRFFPKSWCDRYGDVVIDVVRKEFKDHVGEMETLRSAAKERQHNHSASWITFDSDESENYHPNLFSNQDHSGKRELHTLEDFYCGGSRDINKSVANNPFIDRPESALLHDHNQNPFWSIPL